MSVERAPTSPVAAPPEVAEDDGPLEAPATARQQFDSWLRRLRRPYAWVSIVVVIALAVWWFGIRSSGSSPAAATGITFTKQLVTVTRGTMSTTVSAEGTVAAAQ